MPTKPIPPEIYTKDGLLWMGAHYIPLPLADSVAWQYGFTSAEQMVKYLENVKKP